MWAKQSLIQLAKKYKRSIPCVQRKLDSVALRRRDILSQPLVFTADVSFFSRGDGVLVFRSPKLKENIFWSFASGENPEIYRKARQDIEELGFVFQGIVLDGRKGVREVFFDIPVQMCHFHQKAILRRYLTLHPKLEAGQELSAIGRTLSFINEKDFMQLLSEWYEKWEKFLKEKTFESDGKHWHYTHKKTRSAYRSLMVNLPYLFTFERYPKLCMPNTTNCLDGFFNQMKKLLRVHNGLSEKRRNRVVFEILNGKKKTKSSLPKV